MRDRPHRPLCLIDIAVPRDIDPAVRSIAGVSLIDIDKLEEPVHDTLVHRQQAVPLVERIIDAHVEALERWYVADVGQPVVPSLGRMAEALREAELERLFARCPELDRRQRTLVTGLSLRIVSKLLHPIISSMRAAGDDPVERAARARFIEETFGLFTVEAADEQESPLAGA
jgi:glutamyl-tRNA reductase